MATKALILAVRTPTGKAYEVRAEGGLHYIKGNKLPYFSLTQHAPGAAPESNGAVLDEIVKHWPHLKPLADLHLSDIDGVPMHAEANGWYWLAGTIPEIASRTQHHGGNGQRQHWKPNGDFDGYRNSTPDECLATYAKHVRLSIDEVQVARQLVLDAFLSVSQYDRTYTKAGVNAAREAHKAWIEAQKPRWQREATECINGLNLQVYGDTWNQEAASA